MLTDNFKVTRLAAAIVLPAAVICALVLLTFTRFFATHNYQLSIGITLDLIFTMPLLHILLSKGQKYLKYTGTLFFTAGLLIAGILIPKNDQYLLREIKLWFVPVIEISAIGFFVAKVRKVLAGHTGADDSSDFYTILKSVTTELLPGRIATVLSVEIAAFYYGFFCRRKPVFDNSNFSYHKKTGMMALAGVFIFMILVETTVFHLLLAKWSIKIAWLLSIISVYAALQAFGIARSIMKRPIRITANQLIIPYGILAETIINLNDIIEAEIAGKPAIMSENMRGLSPFKKLEETNIVIQLREAYFIKGIYGSKKLFDTLLIHVDEKELFAAEIKNAIKILIKYNQAD